MEEDTMVLFKIESIWPKVDERLREQMLKEEKQMTEHDLQGEWAEHFVAALLSRNEDIDVSNRTLVEFILNGGFMNLSLAVVHKLAKMQLSRIAGFNPVLQDKLAENIQTFEEELSDLDSDEAAEDLRDDMMNLLFDIYEHKEIGRRLGMDDITLGVYDALRGLIYEGFNPCLVDMSKELAAWLRNRKGKPTRKDVKDEIDKLQQKFNPIASICSTAENYILMDIYPTLQSL